MSANLTEADILTLDAIHLIEASAAKDREHTERILQLRAGQHTQLARALATIAGHMFYTGDPGDVLDKYRAYLFERNTP